VVVIREKALGADHSLLASPLARLGSLHLKLGEAEAAEPLLRRALALGRDREPHREPEILQPRIDLGRCLTALGRYPEAESSLASALADPGLSLFRQRLAEEAMVELYEAWGRTEEAAAHRRRLEAIAAQLTPWGEGE
jgi:tetratricopeptide (TPR) repeat protein